MPPTGITAPFSLPLLLYKYLNVFRQTRDFFYTYTKLDHDSKVHSSCDCISIWGNDFFPPIFSGEAFLHLALLLLPISFSVAVAISSLPVKVVNYFVCPYTTTTCNASSSSPSSVDIFIPKSISISSWYVTVDTNHISLNFLSFPSF